MAHENSDHSVRIAFTLLLLAAILLFSYEGNRPPAPLPASASAQEFSALRAREVLNRLVGDGVPHPVGSAQDEVVRGRVMEEFTKIGYEPQIQTGFACDEYGTCATVQNVLARLEGSTPGPAVLVAAHYDSVPAGPGASDDGMGAAAVLEIARACKSLPTPRNSIIFMIDDGEEAGLIGARVFVEQHPWAKDVRAVVNIDNRGTSGPSVMYETGAANAWALNLYRHSASHPATNSIFYFAYKELPADTDFTIFKNAGYQGVNFAAIGHPVQYHTSLDDFGNADPATLQHHGDNALSSLRAFAQADIANPPQTSAVYFDIFQHWVVSWPVPLSLKLAFGSAFLLLLEITWLLYRKRTPASSIFWGLLSWIVTLFAAGLVAFALQFLLRRLGAEPVVWSAHSLPIQTAFWILGFAAVCFFASRFAPRAGELGLWAGGWLGWATLGILLAFRAPAVSYIFQVATCVAALAAFAFIFRRDGTARGFGFAAIVPASAVALVAFSVLLLLYPGFGNPSLPAISLLVALVLSPIAPLFADAPSTRGLTRVFVPGFALACIIASAFLAVVVPAFSNKSPEHVTFEYAQDSDSGKSQWIVYPASGSLPEPIRLATNFVGSTGGSFPWISKTSFVANAPHLDLPPPTFTILESTELPGMRHYRALLRSERGAPRALVMFPPNSGVDSVQIEGQFVPPQSQRLRDELKGWYAYDCETMPAKGIEMSFNLRAGKPVEVYAVDTSFGLPLEGLFLLKSRPLTATSYGDGDRTLVLRHVELLP